MDRYLQQVLRNWANQQQPPANARARLLLVASAQPYLLEETPSYHSDEYYSRSNDLNSLHQNEPARIFDQLWIYHLSTPALRMV